MRVTWERKYCVALGSKQAYHLGIRTAYKLPYTVASRMGVEKLLTHNVSPNVKDSDSLRPIAIAIGKCHFYTAKLLFDKHAAKKMSWNGLSDVTLTAENGNQDLLELVVDIANQDNGSVNDEQQHGLESWCVDSQLDDYWHGSGSTFRYFVIL